MYPIAGRFVFLVTLITLLGLVLRLLLLPSQPVTFDDYAVGLTAINYVESGNLGPVMWNHPQLCYILTYLVQQLFGTGLIGVKGLSVLFGTLTIPFIALAGRRMVKSETAALIAAFLWSIDSLSIDLSRQAVGEIYQSLFPLCAIYLAYRYRETDRSWWLAAAGIVFGLALSTKWNGAFPLAVTWGWLCLALWREQGVQAGERAARLAYVSAALMVIPLTIYLLTFLPWFARGNSLSEWPDLQQSMYQQTVNHIGHKAGGKGDSHPAAWFLRPVSWNDLSFNKDSAEALQQEASFDKHMTILMGLTNPLVWLLVLPGVFMLARRGWRQRDEGACFLTVLFLSAYLPMVAASRPIYVCTALAVAPFGFIAVGDLLAGWFFATPSRRKYFGLYLACVVAVAVPLFLLAIGKGLQMPIAKEYLRHRFFTEGY